MSFLIAAPEAIAAAASDLASLGSAISTANAAAAASTTSVLAAGADEVSAAIAAIFGAQGQTSLTLRSPSPSPRSQNHHPPKPANPQVNQGIHLVQQH